MDRPFRFRLEQVRDLRERAEDQAREELAKGLHHQLRGEAQLREATESVDRARQLGFTTAVSAGATGAALLAAQAFIERTEGEHRSATLDVSRRQSEVDARRQALTAAMRDREAIEKLKNRRRLDHEREAARREQGASDEIALAMHRRGALA